MRLTFLVEGDSASLPVAAASILAKYTRELFMRALNLWFAERLPGLRPTAGYWQDARRFLEETEGLRRSLGIADDVLIRAR
jgi:ribonuclease HII